MNKKYFIRGTEKICKRLIRILIAIVLMVVSFVLPQPLQKVYAAGTVNAPSTGTFWTNDDLKGIAGIGDAPYYVSGTTFQKANYAGRTWFVIGRENVSGNDTLVLLSQLPIGTSKFDDSSSTYSTSYLVKGLNDSLDGLSTAQKTYNVNTIFGADAKAYVQPVTVSGAANSYLYLPDGNNSDYSNFKVGSSNQFKIPINAWKSNGGSISVSPAFFWLRSSYNATKAYTFWPYVDSYIVDGRGVDSLNGSILPIFNLNLSSGLFASAAPVATSDTTSVVVANDTMNFRIIDATKIKSSATYYGSSVRVIKSSEDSQPVYLCVQYNDGTSDKIYTKAFSSTGTVDLSSIGDLTNAKIWVEMKSSDSKVVYASMAQAHSHSWHYGTKTTNTTDDTLIVYCTSGCTTGLVDADHVASLTLTANNMVYTGSSYDGASLSDTTEWVSAGFTVPAINYMGRGSTSYSASTTAPTAIGTYTAKIMLHTHIAYVDFAITDKPEQTITASDVTVTYGDTGKSVGATLTTGDGTLSYAIKSGSATDVVDVDASGNLTIHKKGSTIITITASGTSTYELTTKDVNVTVNAKTLTDSMVSLDQSTFINDGNGHAPVVTVKDGATTLVVTTDYTLSGNTASETANGNYTITVTGAGNYTGTVNKSWSIADVVTYTVSFEANGGSGTMSNVTGVSGSYTLPLCTFTAPSDKHFKGWATSALGSIITGTIDVNADTTLFAIWEDGPSGGSGDGQGENEKIVKKEEKKKCHHDYVWTVIQKPTLTTDGKEAHKCVKCGHIDDDYPVQPVSAYYFASDEAVKKIKGEVHGATICIDYGVFNTFPDYLLEAIKARPDLTIKFQYKIGKIVYERVVNAETELPAEFPKYAGPQYLDAYFEENVLKEMAY